MQGKQITDSTILTLRLTNLSWSVNLLLGLKEQSGSVGSKPSDKGFEKVMGNEDDRLRNRYINIYIIFFI